MNEQLEKVKHDYADFLQSRLNVAYNKISESKAGKALEKAKEEAEKELRKALGEEGWKALKEWHLDFEHIYSATDGLYYDETYLQGFRDGQTIAGLLNRREPFFGENYQAVGDAVDEDKRQRRAAKRVLRGDLQ